MRRAQRGDRRHCALDRAREGSELAAARGRARVRARSDSARASSELAGVSARLKSLEELDAARAEYGDGARRPRRRPADAVSQLGSVADYLEVDGRLRARGRSLPRRPAAARRRRSARAGGRRPGRSRAHTTPAASGSSIAGSAPAIEPGAVSRIRISRALADVVARQRPCVDVIRAAIAQAWIAGTYDAARAAAASTHAPVATLDGEVFRGAHRRRGRHARRGARHPHDQARDQGAARARRGRARRGGPLARGDRGARRRPSPPLESAIAVAAGGAPPAGEGDRRLRAAGSGARDAVRAHHPQAGTDCDRAPDARRSSFGSQERAAGRGARVDRAHRGGAARRRRAAERGAAPAVRRARSDAGARRSERPRPRRRTRRSSSAPAALAIEVSGSKSLRASSKRASATRQEDLKRAHARRSTLVDDDRAVRGASSMPGCARSTSSRIASATADEASQALRARIRRAGDRAFARRAGRSMRSAPRPGSSTLHARRQKPTCRTSRRTASRRCRPRSTKSPPKWRSSKPTDCSRARGRSTTRRIRRRRRTTRRRVQPPTSAARVERHAGTDDDA